MPPQPTLVVVCGAPGAGKSTLARWLTPRLQACYLDKDAINDAFDPPVREGPFYDGIIRPVTYRALWRLAEANLRLGRDVVVEAPLLSETEDPQWRQTRLEACARIPARLVLLQALVPEPLLRERLAQRAFSRDDVRLRDEQAWRVFVDGTRACAAREWRDVLTVVPMEIGPESAAAQDALAQAGLRNL